MTKKHLGQHFLIDPFINERIINSAQLMPEDLVVEIGPGPGKLTRKLCERARKVIAIELDNRLYARLTAELAGYENIELIHGDALKYPFETLPEFIVVANIPYYITTPIIFRLIAAKKSLKSMTLTIQKEVAERMVAPPGRKEYSPLSIFVQLFLDPSILFFIKPSAFFPSPKVESAMFFRS